MKKNEKKIETKFVIIRNIFSKTCRNRKQKKKINENSYNNTIHNSKKEWQTQKKKRKKC